VVALVQEKYIAFGPGQIVDFQSVSVHVDRLVPNDEFFIVTNVRIVAAHDIDYNVADV
jgi:hypothetical protein